MSSISRRQNTQSNNREFRTATHFNSEEMLARWDAVILSGTYSQEVFDKWTEINTLENPRTAPVANQKNTGLKQQARLHDFVA